MSNSDRENKKINSEKSFSKNGSSNKGSNGKSKTSDEKADGAKADSSEKISNLFEDFKKLIDKGNKSIIVIKGVKDNFAYLSVPVTLAVLITILLPFLTFIIVLLALFRVVKLSYLK